MGSPGRCLAAAIGRAALRSFSHLWLGRHIISAAVYAATLWANSASLDAFSAPGRQEPEHPARALARVDHVRVLAADAALSAAGAA